MFELEKGDLDDFTISLPVEQEMALYVYSYTNRDGVYGLTDKVGSDMPPQITIF